MPGDCFNGNLNMLEVKEQRAQYEVKVMKQIRNLYYNPPPTPELKYMFIVQMILSDLLLIILIIITMMIMNNDNNDETRNKIDRICISSR